VWFIRRPNLAAIQGRSRRLPTRRKTWVTTNIVIYDHVLGAVHAGREPKLTGPYKENDPFHEPLVTYAYLAGVTKNLGLTTGVIILASARSVNRSAVSLTVLTPLYR